MSAAKNRRKIVARFLDIHYDLHEIIQDFFLVFQAADAICFCFQSFQKADGRGCAKVTRSSCRGSNDRVRDKIEHSPKLSDVSNHEF